MPDVVEDMLNEASKKRDKIRLINIEDIRPNKLNKEFPMCELEALALSMRICGQIEPCIVLPEDESGRHELIAGERRWRAAKLNVQQGYNEFEELRCIIREYKTEDHELILTAANGSRESIPVANKIEITRKMRNLYYQQKEIGQISPGTKKRAWISAITGYSERSVQSYLNVIEQDPNVSKQKEKEDISLKNVEEQIIHKLSTKVQVTNKFIKLNYADTEDLNRILEILGLLEEQL